MSTHVKNLTNEQRKNAQLIIDVGRRLGMSAGDIQTALMAAMQESSLRNLKGGDRDSIGLFQQRPSQGWGTAAQVGNATYAATKFYQELGKVKNRNNMSYTQAAQAVQRSGFPDAYAQWEGLSAELLGSGGSSGLTATAVGTGGGAVAGTTAEEMAQNYGYALAFFKSDPSLWKLFNDARKGNWDGATFTANLHGSTWYKNNSESVRQYMVLKTSEPGTLASRKTKLLAQLWDTAESLGAVVNTKILSGLADHALMFNFNDSQIRDILSSYTRAVNGVYHGEAGSAADQIKQAAWRNGISLSAATIQNYVSGVVSGGTNADTIVRQIRKQAQSLAPAFAAELDGGQDLFDIANPYIQAKAKILEQDPAKIDLFDGDIRKALSSKDAKGNPTSQSLWEFENNMRKNPLWLKTQNAQDSLMQAAHKVLNDFGLLGE